MTNWETSSLGAECDLYQPKTISLKHLKPDGQYPVYGANGQIGRYDKFNHQESQVLLSCRGNCGTVNVSEPNSWINGNAMVCNPKSERLRKDFLAYYLQSVDWTPVITGTAQPQITREPLAKVKIPIPSIEEQKRIVEALDSQLSRLEVIAEDLSQTRLKSSHLLMSALEGAISECGSTTRQPLSGYLEILGSRTNVQRGWSPQCLSHPQSDPENWAVLKTTAVQNMSYEPQHNKELPKTLTPKTNLEVRNGDFLMTTTGPRNRCGVVCYVRETPEKLIFSGKILRFRPNQDVLLPEWLELVLASPTYQALLNDLKVGSSDSSVSIGNAQILDLAVPVPSIPKQIELVERIGKIKEISKSFEVSISESIERLGVLRRSILHAAFSSQSGKEN